MNLLLEKGADVEYNLAMAGRRSAGLQRRDRRRL